MDEEIPEWIRVLKELIEKEEMINSQNGK